MSNDLIRSGSVVKSVQRGYAYNSDVTTNNPLQIPISAVNMEKSILIAESRVEGVSDSDPISSVVLDENQIKVIVSTGVNTIHVSWQVIEFY